MQKKFILLLAASCAGLLLGGCVYDEPGYGEVRVSRGSYRPYDEVYLDENPYYYSSGRRYYVIDGRYAYYEGRRPIYVERLPRDAYYITPRVRHREVSVNRYAAVPGNRDYNQGSFSRTQSFNDNRSVHVSSDAALLRQRQFQNQQAIAVQRQHAQNRQYQLKKYQAAQQQEPDKKKKKKKHDED